MKNAEAWLVSIEPCPFIISDKDELGNTSKITNTFQLGVVANWNFKNRWALSEDEITAKEVVDR